MIACTILFAAPQAYGSSDTVTSDPEFDQILSLDISDLDITSVSKRPQKVNDAASAIYVITQEDLLRTGTGSIAEALRMVPGLDVARVAANKWAISSRGFNGTTANKLLVLIDGRTVYTPVFSGTYWDDQQVPVQDVERIEVIRGPGASIWGANAVNGVINIITKKAKDTQDNLVSFIGTQTGGLTEGHHGGKIDDDTYYRVYGRYQNLGSSKNMGGGSNHDDWSRLQSGFRLDGKTGDGDAYTLQGDAYGGYQNSRTTYPVTTAPFMQTTNSDDNSYGGNILGHWSHEISKDSTLNLQAYIDHYTRDELLDTQNVNTADIEAQNTLRLNDRNNIVWGGGARLIMEDLEGSPTVQVPDSNSNHEIANIFAQDEYALVPKQLFLTLGSKIEYNDYTGVEFEPTARLSWHMTDKQMVWGAVSRAVRIPATYEENFSDLFQVNGTTTPTTEWRLVGNDNQKAEELIAYELGHRLQLTQNLEFDTALFYNDFNNLQTIAQAGTAFTGLNGNTVVPYQFDNLGQGHVYGGEFTANWNVTSKWRLTGSYSYQKMALSTSPGAAITLTGVENLAPRNQFSARSYYNISDTVHWDNMFYFVDSIDSVKAYTRYDTRVAWLFTPGAEVSVIGRNLFEPAHAEFPATPQAVFGPSLIGQIRFNF